MNPIAKIINAADKIIDGAAKLTERAIIAIIDWETDGVYSNTTWGPPTEIDPMNDHDPNDTFAAEEIERCQAEILELRATIDENDRVILSQSRKLAQAEVDLEHFRRKAANALDSASKARRQRDSAMLRLEKMGNSVKVGELK